MQETAVRKSRVVESLGGGKKVKMRGHECSPKVMHLTWIKMERYLEKRWFAV